MENKNKNNFLWMFKLAVFSMFFLVSMSVPFKSAFATVTGEPNCYCWTKNERKIENRYSEGTYVDAITKCNSVCKSLVGTTGYYTYEGSDFIPVGLDGSACAKVSDCKDPALPFCNTARGVCVSNAEAAKAQSGTINAPTSGSSGDGGKAASDFVPGTTEAGGLVQCGRGGQRMCTICDIVKGINYLIKYIFRISAVVALAMITVGGVMYIVGEVDRAKAMITNTGKGIFFIFAAWLLVNYSIMLLGAKSNLGLNITGWGNFECTARAR